MKQLYLLFIVIFAFYVNAQQNEFTLEKQAQNYSVINKSVNVTDWTTAELISGHPNEDSRYARVAIDNNNTLHLVYSDDVPDLYPYGQKIIYKKKPEGGVWTDDLIVCEFDGTTVNNHYPDIAVAENGDVHIVFRHTVIGEPEFISHSFYDASEDQWSQTNIASNNTIALRPYPTVGTTFDSRPIAAWEDDELDGTNPNAYFAFYNGTAWQNQILLGRDDDKESHSTKIISLGNHKSMICFAEVSEDGINDEMFYHIFDENSNTLSSKKSIPTISIEKNTYLFNYALAKSKTDNNLMVLAYNVDDTIYTLHYDILADEFTNSGFTTSTNGGAYILQKQLDITCDNNGKFHIPFAQNNTSGLYYVDYSTTTGFGTIETLNTESNQDNPSIVCDTENKLHLIFCDDRDDTNGDQYMDREVYYTTLDISTGVHKISNNTNNLSIYPNPATNELKVESEKLKVENIQVLDITGKVVIISSLQGGTTKQSVDISTLQNGIYFIKIGNNVQKFIKE